MSPPKSLQVKPRDVTWALLLGVLIVLGLSVQEEMGAKGNTLVRILDVILNLVVVGWFLTYLVTDRSNPILLLLLGYWAVRSVENISPILRIMYYNLTIPSTHESVIWAIERTRPCYVIDRVTPHYRKNPVIYVANHALWCLDDVVALGALSAPDLLVVINKAPSGLGIIPQNCRERLCVLDRRGKSGYEALRTAVREEVVGKRRSLVIFAEDMTLKQSVREPAVLRTGTFKIASEFGIPVVPMWIDWPCQFPSILRSTEKRLRVREGAEIPSGDVGSYECRRLALRQLKALSRE